MVAILISGKYDGDFWQMTTGCITAQAFTTGNIMENGLNTMGIRERKQREKDRRRRQIMVAAKRVFLDKGLGEATMEDIAREAEISPGTIYLYFKSKDELCLSLLFKVLHYLDLRLERALVETRGRSTGPRLTAIREALIDLYQFDALVVSYMFRKGPYKSMQKVSPDLIDRVEQSIQGALRKMGRILGNPRCECAGVTSPEAVPELLWAIFSGLVIRHEDRVTDSQSTVDFKESIKTAFSLLAEGLDGGNRLVFPFFEWNTNCNKEDKGGNYV